MIPALPAKGRPAPAPASPTRSSGGNLSGPVGGSALTPGPGPVAGDVAARQQLDVTRAALAGFRLPAGAEIAPWAVARAARRGNGQ